MTSLFAVLGLPQTLSIDAAQVDAAWQSLAREGMAATATGDGDSEMHRARKVLSDPTLRLEHWLELQGVELPRGSSMEPGLMDLFTKIHSALEAADSVSRRHREATTSLGKALLTKEAVQAQLSVQECLAFIQRKKIDLFEQFPEFESGKEKGTFSPATAALGQLKFLRKWEQQCQERLLQLIEC